MLQNELFRPHVQVMSDVMVIQSTGESSRSRGPRVSMMQTANLRYRYDPSSQWRRDFAGYRGIVIERHVRS